MTVILLAISVVLVILRFAGVKNQSFQAVAHLFVGGVFVAYFLTWEPEYLWFGVVLSVAEVIAFVRDKLRGAE